jgi:hypothetical protein
MPTRLPEKDCGRAPWGLFCLVKQEKKRIKKKKGFALVVLRTKDWARSTLGFVLCCWRYWLDKDWESTLGFVLCLLALRDHAKGREGAISGLFCFSGVMDEAKDWERVHMYVL